MSDLLIQPLAFCCWYNVKNKEILHTLFKEANRCPDYLIICAYCELVVEPDAANKTQIRQLCGSN